MPNWAFNCVETQTKEQMDKLIDLVGSDEEPLMDFRKIVPQPKAIEFPPKIPERAEHTIYDEEHCMVLAITDGKIYEITESDFWDYVAKMNVKANYPLNNLCRRLCEVSHRMIRDITPTDEKVLKPIDEIVMLGHQFFNTYARYGACDWYRWNINNWGTKWNACEQYRNSDTCLTFQTAWSPVPELMLKLSAMPEIDFPIYFSFGEEQFDCYAGEYVMKDGHVLEGCDTSHGDMTTEHLFRIASNLLDPNQETWRYDPKNDAIIDPYQFDEGPYNGYASFDNVPYLSMLETEMSIDFHKGLYD